MLYTNSFLHVSVLYAPPAVDSDYWKNWSEES